MRNLLRRFNEYTLVVFNPSFPFPLRRGHRR